MAEAFENLETVWIPLPDGTRLAARIWLPADHKTKRAPAVLEYLPYRRRDVTSARDASVYPAFAAAGIAGVRVDLRGTGDSEGAFDDEYSETELSDIEAVIAWIAEQPWCSGKVGMMGISWGGFNALQVAARRPKALGAVISIASTVDRFADDIHYKGGAHLSSNLNWAVQMLARAATPPDAAVLGDTWRDRWHDRLAQTPSLIFRWLSHQRRDDYWRHGSICEDFQSVDVPALMIAGWADGYRNTPWLARAGLGGKARSITGPWVHLYPHFASPAPRMDFVAEAIAWWRHWLMEEDYGIEDLPAHRLYLSEAVRPDAPRAHEPGDWIAIQQSEPDHRLFYLTAAGLSAENPGATSEVFLRSPLHLGVDGGAFFTQVGDADLPGDQRAEDGLALCFETACLDAPLDIIGLPQLSLPVALDAGQGNLIGRLLDVHPDGTSHRITLGVLNLSHRGGSARPLPMEPGQSAEITLQFDATAYRLRPGHRLRLALSTSYFPLVLPPPTDVTATLRLGPEARLELPTCAFSRCEMPDPGPDPRPKFPTHPGPSAERRVTRDRTSGRVAVISKSDSGQIEQSENGMKFRSMADATWSITARDTLSLRGEERCTLTHERHGVTTQVSATGKLTASTTHWHVEMTLTAEEDGAEVFSRHWSEAIPRDHM